MRVVIGLLLTLALVLPMTVWAQPPNPVVTVIDRGCERLTCPPTFITPTSCTSATFTVEVSGTYAFDVWTACQSSTNCFGCMSCAAIYSPSGTQPVAVCSSRDCVNRDCNNTCTVNLRAGERYTLQVCLEPCPNQPDCGQCRDDCVAGGCIRALSARPCYQ
ncbi:MAG TPA: hypothetical protein VGL38_04850 [bacterium]|jgi:hypothetical protein